ncbi:hypothetical protein BpHYR1_024237 [Brachionus plicatilis]|uniref:Uncharacterized protein n=1 Tax=Brachionus plicatilis TaxID=10195 RepID=A0A3M7R8K5_BRAPC|nr:hypothetical protein BpHYR1_024237 [Brachionus plicatilis]
MIDCGRCGACGGFGGASLIIKGGGSGIDARFCLIMMGGAGGICRSGPTFMTISPGFGSLGGFKYRTFIS